MIDVQRLLVLREVAHAGSFAGAAAELRRTPSAVSQQIAALERGAGVPLVERSTRGVVLTDAGRLPSPPPTGYTPNCRQWCGNCATCRPTARRP